MSRLFEGISKAVFFTFSLSLWSFSLQAASLSDSIVNTPRGTIFELQHEFEIPANQNFLVLGRNNLTESLNEISQTTNQQNGRFNASYNSYSRYNRQSNYYYYDDYLTRWQESAEESYYRCLERNRTYYYNDNGYSSRNSTIISQGNGNTNVFVDNRANSTPTYGSYLNDNTCIQPEHTIAVLLLDPDESDGGGFFRNGYEFEVSSVRTRRSGDFNVVTINFNHDIAKGIRIITTESPQNISLGQLDYNDNNGFWSSLGSALTDIGGNHFSISFPRKRYYD